MYIGGSSSPVSIGEVITTANTQSGETTIGQTGDIYGKASSVNDAKIVYDTEEHGIIMGIFSLIPDASNNKPVFRGTVQALKELPVQN